MLDNKALESLLLHICQKDITDSIVIDVMARDWANIKTKELNLFSFRL